MKKTILFLIAALVFSGFALSAADNNEQKLGRIFFPKDFVHAGKDYKRGSYIVKIAYGDTPKFFVSDRKGNMLFEELAVTKEYKGKSRKFKFRLRKELLKGYEYFRIQVTRPDNIYLGYFLLKK